jgi:hypothetical protein
LTDGHVKINTKEFITKNASTMFDNDQRWLKTAQHFLLHEIQASRGEIFVPLVDHHSKAAYRSSLSDLCSGALTMVNLWPFALLVVPLHATYWFWQRRRPPPGWQIDPCQRSIVSVRQKYRQSIKITSEMGLLAHHRQIDITHPTRGPLLTLFTAAGSNDSQDAVILETLAKTLVDKLQLRLVGCRITMQ